MNLAINDEYNDAVSLRSMNYSVHTVSTGGTIMFLNIPREIIALLNGARL